MPGRELELVEVVLGRLDLAVVAHVVAETDERVLDGPPNLRDRVEPTARRALARERDVDRLLGEATFELGAVELRLAVGDGALDRFARRSAPARSRGRAPREAPA